MRRDPSLTDEWLAGDPSHRSSIYTEPPRHRAWTFAAVSLGLVGAAVGMCWLIASSSPDHATTEVTSAPLPTVAATTPAPPAQDEVPTTVQPAVVPTAPPVLEKPAPVAVNALEAPKPPAAEATPPPVANAPPVVPVQALPAAPPAHRTSEIVPRSTLHVVEQPADEPTSE